MKDPSSPTDLCPFCGKAFKRLKSHLPHCKMANAKNQPPATDHADKGTTVSQMAVKKISAPLPGNVEKQYSKGKRKTNVAERTGGLKKQLQIDNTASSSRVTRPKVEDALSGNSVPQRKATVNMEAEYLKKDLNNMSLGKSYDNVNLIYAKDSGGKHSSKEHSIKALSAGTLSGTNKVMIGPSAPVLKYLSARPDIERTVPAGTEKVSVNNTCLDHHVMRQQVCNDRFEGTGCARPPVHEQISKKTGGVANNSVAISDHFPGSLNGKHFHKQVTLGLEQCSESSSSCTKFTEVATLCGLPSPFAQESLGIQWLPGIPPALYTQDFHETCNIKALETIGKSMENNLDLPSPHKVLPVGEVEPADGSLGLQWIPQLYSNYVRFRIAPGRQDQRDLDRRLSEAKEPSGARPERCKPITDIQLASRRLMDVRLGELPSWLAHRRFSMKMFPELIQNARERYYNKYINVRKGGVGGLAMLLAGYCVLSYAWNFDHIKQDRWRKYH